MKPSTTDYLSITAALVAILLCGFGTGFLVGERVTFSRVTPPAAHDQPQREWTAETVARLTSELKLTPEQTAAVEKEVTTAAREISAARRDAIRDYHRALLDLHGRILPHLDPGQRRMVEQSREKIKISLDNLQERREP